MGGTANRVKPIRPSVGMNRLFVLFLRRKYVRYKSNSREFRLVKEKLATRGIKPEELDKLVAIDKERREALTKSEQLKQKRNEVSDQIAQAKRNKEDASEAIKAMREVGKEIKDLDKEVEDLTEKQNYILLRLPNFPADSDPIGPDESYNEEVRKWHEPTKLDFEPKPHWEIGTELNILDWDTAAKVSGARFVYYKGAGALLERAVSNFS